MERKLRNLKQCYLEDAKSQRLNNKLLLLLSTAKNN